MGHHPASSCPLIHEHCNGRHGAPVPCAAITHLALPLSLQVDNTKVHDGPEIGETVQNFHEAPRILWADWSLVQLDQLQKSAARSISCSAQAWTTGRLGSCQGGTGPVNHTWKIPRTRRRCQGR